MNKSNYVDFEGYISANEHLRWNQSVYFNAYDPESRIGCFIRLGFMENLKLTNCWAVFFLDGKPLFQRINANLPYTQARMDRGVELAGFRVTRIEPLNRARIQFEDTNFAADLTWEATQPMMDSIAFTADAGDGSFARNVAHAHLEGSCRVTGNLMLRDARSVQFNGMGARDVAAGTRDWDALRHYRLAMPIFNDGLTIIGIHGISNVGKSAYMKMLHDGQKWVRIGQMEDELEFEDDDMTVRATTWKVSAEDGRRWTVTGRRLFRCFIPFDTFMLAEHMMEFTREDGVVGYGLLECGFRFPWSGNGT
jgi:hypothetical protein